LRVDHDPSLGLRFSGAHYLNGQFVAASACGDSSAFAQKGSVCTAEIGSRKSSSVCNPDRRLRADPHLQLTSFTQ
jgi:hypothetical protein